MIEHKIFYRKTGILSSHSYTDNEGYMHGECVEYYTTGSVKTRTIYFHGFPKYSIMDRQHRDKQLIKVAEAYEVPLMAYTSEDRMFAAIKYGIRML